MEVTTPETLAVALEQALVSGRRVLVAGSLFLIGEVLGLLEGNFYSDVFESYSNKQKNAPANPQAGEAALYAGATGTGWIGNNYLNRNKLTHTFTIDTAQKVSVGIGFRGRYAIANNGWFVDNLSLRRVE